MRKPSSVLAEFTTGEEQSEPADQTLVPNKQPTLSGFPYRIALIGEAPGKDEVSAGEPFVGTSGRFLSALLSKANIVRDACFVGNVCQLRPPGNEISSFKRTGPEITAGLIVLQQDLDKFNPNLCVLLGKTALWAALGNDAIFDWRGSLFIGTRPPFLGRKCLASLHPAYCLRDYSGTPLLMFDLKKAATAGRSKELSLPQRTLVVSPNFLGVLNTCERLRRERQPISVDIEGGIGTMSCISIAEDATHSFIVPFARLDGSSYWSFDEEVAIWRVLADLLFDQNVPKVLQNSLYDRFVLQYSYNLVMANVTDDTMLKHHELYCELEKSLGFQASIYTDQPFYKSDRKTDDQETFYRYCCTDSAVTMEINNKLEGYLKPAAKEHYRFNVSMLNPLLYMELRGIRYDTTLAQKRLKDINQIIYGLQANLDSLAGFGIDPNKPRQELMSQVRDIMCYKRDRSRPKKEFEDDFDPAMRILLGEGPLTREQIGHINIACGLDMNIKSAALKQFLYGKLKLPVQYHKDTGEPTTNYEALLKLSKKHASPTLQLIIDIGELRTRAQMLAIRADQDGRVRCGYNVVGTSTERITSYTSPTGSGYNLQTIPDEDHLRAVGHPLRPGMRDLFLADRGYWFFQCDLKGSDGWTIGAHLNSLGEPAMLDDLRFGIKPAARICYMLRHGNNSLDRKSRNDIKELLKEVKKEDWDYFACKIAIWGICYTMGPDLLANEILQESAGKVALSRADVQNFHSAVHAAYRIRVWHEATARKIATSPVLTSDGGHSRRFFGRAKEILGDVLSHEPQYITTRATKLALHRLWSDPENRIGNALRVEPLHTVHDSLNGQFKIEDTTWALSHLRGWFNNELTIAGQKIIIPFEGTYGRSWGELKESFG